jgi:hypothetical protein
LCNDWDDFKQNNPARYKDFAMRKLTLALVAMTIVIPTISSTPALAAEKYYKGNTWRGKDGRLHCRKRDGTTGLIVGAAAGALVGRTIDTKGDRTVGTLGGAIAGGLIGREIDRSRGGRYCR